MAKNPSTKGAPSKVTNTKRQDKRSAKRESSLRTRLVQAERDGTDQVLIDKLTRLYNGKKQGKRRCHNRGRNLTTPNKRRAMRRAEGGAFSMGKKSFGVDMERHHASTTMEHVYKAKTVDVGTTFPVVALQYTGTRNLHRNADNFEQMGWK